MALSPKKSSILINSKLPIPFESVRFIFGLAHELDGPLKSVIGRMQKLIEEYKTRDFEYISYKDFRNILATLERLNRQLMHCSRTTGRMLDLTKGKSGVGESSCRVNEVVADIVGVLAQQLETSKIKLNLQLAPTLPTVRIGHVECHQIINNILVNAIQSMPGGGLIRIKTFMDKKSGLVGIDVSDQGVGIAPEHLPKVFEPFFTTKERGVEKNIGLGLSIVYSIIHGVGGIVSINSSLRKGTCVHVLLPTGLK